MQPEVVPCDNMADGFYCGWPALQAVERRHNMSLNLPVSPCSDHFYQCVAGVTYALQVVPPGTWCVDGQLIDHEYATCAPVMPSATPSPGTVTATATPSPSVGSGGSSCSSASSCKPHIQACLHLPDGYYCGATAAEMDARANRTAHNETNYECYDHFYMCVAGATYPLMVTPPGTKCYRGTFLNNYDARCGGDYVPIVSTPPNPSASPSTGNGNSGSTPGRNTTLDYTHCPADGLYCDSQCGQWFWYCVDKVRQPAVHTAQGTVCYDWGQGGYLVHENDLRCENTNNWCAAGETSVRCHVQENETCSDQFYHCNAGQPYFLQNVALGTKCFNGTLVHAHDAVCTRGDYVSEYVVWITTYVSGISGSAAGTPTGGGPASSVIAGVLCVAQPCKRPQHHAAVC
ncbi:hypothetical protein EON62_01845 [archaeon]|nr:MAG: hypothetical protein EON62_01845 [archaeon]